MSHRSQVANSGSRPIEACSAACAAPGRSAVGQPGVLEDRGRHRPPDRGGAQRPLGQVERLLGDHLARGHPALEVGHHLVAPPPPRRTTAGTAPTATCSRSARIRMSVTSRAEVEYVGLRALDDRHVLVEVERADQPGLAEVDVDRALVGGPVRGRGVDGADHPAGDGLDQLDRLAAAGADVGQVAGPATVGPEPPRGPAPQQPGLGQPVDGLAGGRAEQRQVGLGQRRLLGGRAQVRPEDVVVGGVEDAGLDRPAQQHLGVVDEVGVQRVVAGHHHAERVLPAATGPADLLPQLRRGSRGSRPSAPRRGR